MSGGEREAGPESEGDAGRYLFCAVRLRDGAESGFETDGIDGGRAYLVADRERGVGAVVQRRDSPFDSADPGEVRRWLLRHQAVVDDAAERFGTPLPFRFDTLLRGGDDRVADWLDAQAGTLVDHLDSFAGRSEYRVELSWPVDALTERVADDDPELRDLRARREEADEGTAFLLGKQCDRRVGQLLDGYVEERRNDLIGRLDPHVDGLQDLSESRSGTALLGADASEAAEGEEAATRSVRLAVLARREEQERIGEVLDEFAAVDGASVKYTGPWPPYTFAPELGGVGERED